LGTTAKETNTGEGPGPAYHPAKTRSTSQ